MNELNDHSTREHALLSASSAHRWLACPPSAVASEGYPEQDTEFTREGTKAHEVAELYARGEHLDGPTDEVTQEMIDCAERYAAYILECITDDKSAIVLTEQRVDFSPWVPDGFGTADCIIIQGTTMDVIDYKYGVGVSVSAVGNPQEMLYGLGALNDFGIAYDVETIRLHIFQPRINNISVDEMPVDELTAWGDKVVKPTAAKAAKGKGTYKEGAHCKFCPHAGRCRQLTKACTMFVETHNLRVGVPVLAPHEVAEVLQKEPLITLWLKKVKAQALSDLLDGQEVPGWKVVEGKLGNRKWTDEAAVAERLRAEGYQLGEITETKLLSPAQMDKALGKKKVAELLDGMIDRSPGAPTVVPETDKRPVYDRAADFEKLED